MIPETRILNWGILAGRTFISEFGISRVLMGNWNFYVPDLELKLFYPQDGFVRCLSSAAPRPAALMAGEYDGVDKWSRYSADDWKQIYSKKVRRRAIENYVTAKRLWNAGIGPEPNSLCWVRRFMHTRSWSITENAGMFIENAHDMPKKEKTTLDEVLDSGVVPDKSESCVRGQIGGYVIDLNSVVGVMPADAEKELNELEEEFSEVVKTATTG